MDKLEQNLIEVLGTQTYNIISLQTTICKLQEQLENVISNNEYLSNELSKTTAELEKFKN